LDGQIKKPVEMNAGPDREDAGIVLRRRRLVMVEFLKPGPEKPCPMTRIPPGTGPGTPAGSSQPFREKTCFFPPVREPPLFSGRYGIPGRAGFPDMLAIVPFLRNFSAR
jgi:hypothetical protein